MRQVVEKQVEPQDTFCIVLWFDQTNKKRKETNKRQKQKKT